MKITIATGIYPPEIGGPAEYAKNLSSEWIKNGHKVSVKIFSRFYFLPTGIRHIFYFFSILISVARADLVLILDTFSAALPSVLAAKLFGKKTILRTGGDFLWELYVERTGDSVLLRNFYTTCLSRLSFKERIVFSLIRFVLSSVDAIIWSTEWQRDIFMKPYNLLGQRHFIVENYYGEKINNLVSDVRLKKEFLASSRKLKWKNTAVLEEIFKEEDIKRAEASLYTKSLSHEEFIAEMNACYAYVLVSLGDISPNSVLDAIRLNKPFIVTKETGIFNRIQNIAIFVDPQNKQDIKEKILWLLQEKNYEEQSKKVEQFSFVHSWQDISREYLDIYKKI